MIHPKRSLHLVSHSATGVGPGYQTYSIKQRRGCEFKKSLRFTEQQCLQSSFINNSFFPRTPVTHRNWACTVIPYNRQPYPCRYFIMRTFISLSANLCIVQASNEQIIIRFLQRCSLKLQKKIVYSLTRGLKKIIALSR